MLGEWLKDNARADAERKLSKQQVASGGVLYVNEVAEYPHFKYRQHVAEYERRTRGRFSTAQLLTSSTRLRDG